MQIAIAFGLPSSYELKIISSNAKKNHYSDMHIDKGGIVYCDDKLKHCELIDIFEVDNIEFDCYKKYLGIHFNVKVLNEHGNDTLDIPVKSYLNDKSADKVVILRNEQVTSEICDPIKKYLIQF